MTDTSAPVHIRVGYSAVCMRVRLRVDWRNMFCAGLHDQQFEYALFAFIANLRYDTQ